jgi:hypothetical protein
MDLFYGLGVLFIGLAAGVLSGAFGIGGATITTPALRDVLGTSGYIALGTTLPVVIPTAASGAIVYHRKKMLNYKTALVCAVPGSIAAVLAAIATRYFGGEVLMLVTAVYIAVIAVGFSMNKKPKKPVTRRDSMPLVLVIGLTAGAVSGFLGVGGGVILVPAMTMLLGFSMHEAIGTSLLTMAIYSVPGSIGHFLLGNIDVGLLIPIAAGSIFGAQLGARLAVKTGEKKLRMMFSGFLFIVAIMMAVLEIQKLV